MLEVQNYITSGEKLFVKGENYCREAQLSTERRRLLLLITCSLRGPLHSLAHRTFLQNSRPDLQTIEGKATTGSSSIFVRIVAHHVSRHVSRMPSLPIKQLGTALDKKLADLFPAARSRTSNTLVSSQHRSEYI